MKRDTLLQWLMQISVWETENNLRVWNGNFHVSKILRDTVISRTLCDKYCNQDITELLRLRESKWLVPSINPWQNRGTSLPVTKPLQGRPWSGPVAVHLPTSTRGVHLLLCVRTCGSPQRKPSWFFLLPGGLFMLSPWLVLTSSVKPFSTESFAHLCRAHRWGQTGFQSFHVHLLSPFCYHTHLIEGIIPSPHVY